MELFYFPLQEIHRIRGAVANVRAGHWYQNRGQAWARYLQSLGMQYVHLRRSRLTKLGTSLEDIPFVSSRCCDRPCMSSFALVALLSKFCRSRNPAHHGGITANELAARNAWYRAFYGLMGIVCSLLTTMSLYVGTHLLAALGLPLAGTHRVNVYVHDGFLVCHGMKARLLTMQSNTLAR